MFVLSCTYLRMFLRIARGENQEGRERSVHRTLFVEDGSVYQER